MRTIPLVVAASWLVAGCAAMPPGETPLVRIADFKPEQVRRPFVIVQFAFSPDIEAKERQDQRSDYEGALLEGLNARAVLARDVQFLDDRDPRPDATAALARARELRADHAVLVEVRAIRPAEPLFCAETRRPFRARAAVWSQAVRVLRARDGALRLSVPTGGGLEVSDLEPDCESPRKSTRRTATQALDDAAARLLDRVVGP